MKYCASICYNTIDELIKEMQQNIKRFDFIEIRIENLLLKKDNANELFQKLIKHSGGKPIILTNRNKKNGGLTEINEKERTSILQIAAKYPFKYIDIECDTNKKEVLSIIKHRQNKGIIISYHNFEKTPLNLDKIYSKIKKYNPDVIKICTYANSISDNLKIFTLMKKVPLNQKIVAHAMGEKGEISRIIGGITRNHFTFMATGENLETAPGQLTYEKMNSIYRVNRLKKNFKIFGLAGNPVKHSKGIIIHNSALDELNINAIYLNFLIDDFKKFLTDFMDIYSGLSVTIPFKELAMKYSDTVEENAGIIGAVNTIINKNNKLYGYNTDYYGIKKSFEKINLQNKKVILLGSGGAARSALCVLKNYKSDVIILNRTMKKAEELAKEFNCNFAGYEEVKNLKYNILINTTPVGMGTMINDSPVEKSFLSKFDIVFDMIYNPLKTKLLNEAKDMGCKTISGLKMFYYQAEEQFRLFTGKNYSFFENRQKLLKLIKNADKNYK